MKLTPCILPVVAVFASFTLVGCSSDRIEVANSGDDVVEVTNDSNETTLRLGQNGTGYFDRGTDIQIGEARIRLGRRLNVINTGPDVLEIAYVDGAGSERTMLLGEGAIGYFDTTSTISMGDVSIRVGRP